MKILLKALLVILIWPAVITAEEFDSKAPEFKGLQHLTEYLGLMPEDISFRPDYTERDDFRLRVVSELMNHPLGMIDYASQLKNTYVKSQPEILARLLFDDIDRESQVERKSAYRASLEEVRLNYSLYYSDINLNQLLTKAAMYIDVVFPHSVDMSLGQLSLSQRKFLRNEFKELLVATPVE